MTSPRGRSRNEPMIWRRCIGRWISSRTKQVLPCSFVLRGIARHLVALFGSGAGHVVIRTDIEHLSLPAYKRRALVLAASELVSNALRHGFAGKVGGRIDVTLRAFGTSHVRLTVVDDGVGVSEAHASGQGGIAVALADLLEGALVYRQSGAVGTNAEIVLPTYKDLSVTTRLSQAIAGSRPRVGAQQISGSITSTGRDKGPNQLERVTCPKPSIMPVAAFWALRP